MLYLPALLLAQLAALSFASPVANLTRNGTASSTPDNAPKFIKELPRLVVYFQTTHDQSNKPISMLPLVNQKGIALTHLIVCSLHINEGGQVHLNDHPPSDPLFRTLWNETQVMKKAGVKVMGMVGGAAGGSFTTGTLDGNEATFKKYYGQLHDVIRDFHLDGLDIDVEQSMSQMGIERLIDSLRKDFGPYFIITLAPVASALHQDGNLSGFDYDELENRRGFNISFYNAQFYSGFGSMTGPHDFERIVDHGYKASRVVAGQLTSPSNGYGYIPYGALNSTVVSLRKKYGQIGGIMGWEYFNSQPGREAEPWKWAQVMTQILRPNLVPRLTITRPTADLLTAAYRESRAAAEDFSISDIEEPDDVDYYAMINA